MLSHRIAKLRKNIGMNQLQLAQMLHLSPSTIGMYEQGRRIPNVDVLIQISKVFNVSLDYLITGSEYILSSKNQDILLTSCRCECCKCYCQKFSMRPKTACRFKGVSSC